MFCKELLQDVWHVFSSKLWHRSRWHNAERDKSGFRSTRDLAAAGGGHPHGCPESGLLTASRTAGGKGTRFRLRPGKPAQPVPPRGRYGHWGLQSRRRPTYRCITSWTVSVHPRGLYIKRARRVRLPCHSQPGGAPKGIGSVLRPKAEVAG